MEVVVTGQLGSLYRPRDMPPESRVWGGGSSRALRSRSLSHVMGSGLRSGPDTYKLCDLERVALGL